MDDNGTTNCNVLSTFAVAEPVRASTVSLDVALANIVVVSNSTISKNKAGNIGGGIENYHGGAAVSDSVVTGNKSGVAGGGVSNYGDTALLLVYNDSTISYNKAKFIGGGISSIYGDNNVQNSTITGNKAKFNCGGIYNYFPTGFVGVGNTFSGNKASTDRMSLPSRKLKRRARVSSSGRSLGQDLTLARLSSISSESRKLLPRPAPRCAAIIGSLRGGRIQVYTGQDREGFGPAVFQQMTESGNGGSCIHLAVDKQTKSGRDSRPRFSRSIELRGRGEIKATHLWLR